MTLQDLKSRLCLQDSNSMSSAITPQHIKGCVDFVAQFVLIHEVVAHILNAADGVDVMKPCGWREFIVLDAQLLHVIRARPLPGQWSVTSLLEAWTVL